MITHPPVRPVTVPPSSDAEKHPPQNPPLTVGILRQILSSGGVDRLSLSIPLQDFERDGEAWDQVQVRFPGAESSMESYSVNRKLGGATIHLRVSEMDHPTVRWWGRVEFNPSRVAHPDCVDLCDLDQLPQVLELVRPVVQERLTPTCEVEDFNVTRLDIARDFSVESAGQILTGLHQLRRPHARTNSLYSNPTTGEAQTLTVGSKSGLVRLYDKLAEAGPELVDGPTLRWELQGRKPWLRRHGISKVQDLYGGKVQAMTNERWDWSGMGHEFTSDEATVARRVAALDLSASKKKALLGHLHFRRLGVVLDESHVTRREYDRLAREAGVVLSSDSLDQVPSEVSVMRRLDWDSGREVLRVA